MKQESPSSVAEGDAAGRAGGKAGADRLRPSGRNHCYNEPERISCLECESPEGGAGAPVHHSERLSGSARAKPASDQGGNGVHHNAVHLMDEV